MYSKDDKVGMGRKGSTPAGEEFMPGTSAKELKDLAKREMDALTAKKYTAAYHRKRGLSFKAIGAILLASYHAVRGWLTAMHKGGLEAAPRRKSPGRRRSIPLDIRQDLVIDIHRGPQASGYKANVWTFKLLHDHLGKKYGVRLAYSTAAKNFKEMGIRLKIPRPANPRAASPEERLKFQRKARKTIEAAAKDDFYTVFLDEGHAQAYKNGRATAGLRGVEAVRTSSIGRPVLTIFVCVGYGWVLVIEATDKADSEAYIKVLDRICELVGGNVLIIDDNAGYHVSHRSSDHIRDNSDRLRRVGTLPYTPNDNVAEPQIRDIKSAMSNVGYDSVGAMSSGLKWCFENGLINPVKFYEYATVDSPRISPQKAAAIRKKLRPGEHFVYVKRGMPDEEIALPTVEELRAKEEDILPPEKRALLPPKLANSGLPANFLARLSPVLLKE